MKSKIPPFLKKYFWEIDFKILDPHKRSHYIIERLLEYGDEEAVRWMFRNFKREEIIDTLMHSRVLSLKSANFWAMFLGLDKDKVLCLSKPFRQIQRAIWKY